MAENISLRMQSSTTAAYAGALTYDRCRRYGIKTLTEGVGLEGRRGLAALVTHALAPWVIPSRGCGGPRFHVPVKTKRDIISTELIDCLWKYDTTMHLALPDRYVVIWPVRVPASRSQS